MSESIALVGLSQDYIENLTAELEAAVNCYNEYHQASVKAEAEYDLSQEWLGCIKAYLDRVGTTYDMVSDLDAFINMTIKHAEKICKAVSLSKEATEILANCIRCLSLRNEELKHMVKVLMEIIDCLNDPILNPNVSIMQCLNDFKDKVDMGLVAVKAALRELLNLMKCMMEMDYYICSTMNAPFGLLDTLKQLDKILDCANPHTVANYNAICRDYLEILTPPGDLDCPDCSNDCGDTVPAIHSDIKCDRKPIIPTLCMDCSNPFLEKLKHRYTKASQQVCYAKCVWEYFIDMTQKAKTNMDATQAALTAAVAAKSKCAT